MQSPCRPGAWSLRPGWCTGPSPGHRFGAADPRGAECRPHLALQWVALPALGSLLAGPLAGGLTGAGLPFALVNRVAACGPTASPARLGLLVCAWRVWPSVWKNPLNEGDVVTTNLARP